MDTMTRTAAATPNALPYIEFPASQPRTNQARANKIGNTIIGFSPSLPHILVHPSADVRTTYRPVFQSCLHQMDNCLNLTLRPPRETGRGDQRALRRNSCGFRCKRPDQSLRSLVTHLLSHSHSHSHSHSYPDPDSDPDPQSCPRSSMRRKRFEKKRSTRRHQRSHS